jgi:hypothetical protein
MSTGCSLHVALLKIISVPDYVTRTPQVLREIAGHLRNLCTKICKRKTLAIQAIISRLIEVGATQEVPTSWAYQLAVIFPQSFRAVRTHLYAEYLAPSASLGKLPVVSFAPRNRGWNIVHNCAAKENFLNPSIIYEAGVPRGAARRKVGAFVSAGHTPLVHVLQCIPCENNPREFNAYLAYNAQWVRVSERGVHHPALDFLPLRSTA